MNEWVKWEDLPFPECRGRVLRELTGDLPFMLFYTAAAAIEDEVVDFTEKRGWHKLDKLMPLMNSEFFTGFDYYLRRFRLCAENLKASCLPLF